MRYAKIKRNYMSVGDQKTKVNRRLFYLEVLCNTYQQITKFQCKLDQHGVANSSATTLLCAINPWF